LVTTSHSALGVERKLLVYRFGQTNCRIDVWVAGFATPNFVVDAYLNKNRKLVLCVGEGNVRDASFFAHKACAFVALDNTEATTEFASSLNCPVFTGPDAVYWALREALL